MVYFVFHFMLSPLSDGNVHGRPPPQVDALQFISLHVSTGSQRTTFTIFLSGHWFSFETDLLKAT